MLDLDLKSFNLYQQYLNYFFRKPFLDSLKNCEQIQKNLFFKIILENVFCRFGSDFNFDKISSISDFKKLVSIQTYDNLLPYIEDAKRGVKNSIVSKDIVYFAITSGTTSFQKFIPHTKEYILGRKFAWQVWINSLYDIRPKSFSVFGKILNKCSRNPVHSCFV